jgi:type IV pilus assembly protein PilX
MTGRYSQRGVSLIIAIIILGAMMLSGIAMFRKLSASAVIVGNLSSTNSAIASADRGAENARTWLITQGTASLYTSSAGYFSAHCYMSAADEAFRPNCNVTTTPSAFDPFAFDWTGANQSTLVTSNDGAGNEIRTVTHRLCDTSGSLDVANQSCVLALTTGAGSGGRSTVGYGGQQLSTSMKPYYRITTRVAGPRNAVVYTQVTMF